MIPVRHIEQARDDTTILLTNLLPYTNYAYYIRSYIIQEKALNIWDVVQGQSKIRYFKTAPDLPSPPYGYVAHKTANTMAISWYKTTLHDELIDEYIIEVVHHPNIHLDERDYCVHPIVPDPPQDTTAYGESCIDKCCKLTRLSFKFPNDTYNTYDVSDDCYDDPDYMEYVEFYEKNNEFCGLKDPKCEEAFKSYKFGNKLTEFLDKKKMDEDAQTKENIYPDSKPKKKPKGKITYPYGTPLRTERVTNTTFKIEFKDLRPFQLYSYFIFACSELLGCGIPFILHEKTNAVPITTEIDLNITRNGSDVFINFHEPIDPNEALVHYNIEKTIINETRTEVHCITKKAHAENNFR